MTVHPSAPESRRRVALVANPSADLYGSDRMMLESVRGLLDRGWRVVVAASQGGPLVPVLEELGAEVVVLPVPVFRKGHLSPKGMVELTREVREGIRPMSRLVRDLRPDVLYVSTVTIPLWFVVAKRHRVPVVAHIHEAEAGVHPVLRHGLAFPSVLADLVIYNSRTSQQVGTRPVLARADRHRIVHNGVGGPGGGDTATDARSEIDRPRLCYVGRLSPRKGVDVAVEAVALLRERGLEASLDLVGAVFPGYEWYERDLRALVAERGLEEQVTFSGFRERVWEHLAAADIALVPSRGDESFGNVVIEAVLAGRPVVVSDHTGLREAMAGRAAVVPVPADDPVAVADAVERVIAEWPDWRERARADVAPAAAAYAPEGYRSRVAELLADVATSSR